MGFFSGLSVAYGFTHFNEKDARMYGLVLAYVKFGKIPTNRLLLLDAKSRPGILTDSHLRHVSLPGMGQSPRYLGWYVAGGLVSVALTSFPGSKLTLNQHTAALMLLPGTAFPTRLTAVGKRFCQDFLSSVGWLPSAVPPQEGL